MPHLSKRWALVSFTLFLVLVTSFSLLYFRSLRLQSNPSKLPFTERELSNSASVKIDDVRFEFVSLIPDYQIDEGSVDSTKLKDYLTKLGLWPVKNNLFIGEPADGQWILSGQLLYPSKVRVILADMSRLENDVNTNPDLKSRQIYAQTSTDRKAKVIYLAGYWNDKSSQLDMVTYIDPSFAKDLNRSGESLLNRVALREIYINFQSIPFADLDIFKFFEEKVQTDEITIFKLKEKILLNLTSLLSKVKIVKEVKAQLCNGTISCGRPETNSRCVGGPSSGSDCTVSGDCLGGLCQSFTDCVDNGVTANCAWQSDRSCGNSGCACYIGGRCGVSGGGGGSSCGNCSAAGCVGKDEGDSCPGGVCTQQNNNSCVSGGIQCRCQSGGGGSSGNRVSVNVYAEADFDNNGTYEYVAIRTPCAGYPLIPDNLAFYISQPLGDPGARWCNDYPGGGVCGGWTSYADPISFDATPGAGSRISSGDHYCDGNPHTFIEDIGDQSTWEFDVEVVPSGWEVDKVYKRADGVTCNFKADCTELQPNQPTCWSCGNPNNNPMTIRLRRVATSCPGMTAPANPSVTDIACNGVTLNWTPGTGGTTQILYLDGPATPTTAPKAKVEAGCPAGDCLVQTALVPGANSYDLAGLLLPGSTYYWRVVEYKDDDNWMDFDNRCKQAFSEEFTTLTATCSFTISTVVPVEVGIGATRNVIPGLLTSCLDTAGSGIDSVAFNVSFPNPNVAYVCNASADPSGSSCTVGALDYIDTTAAFTTDLTGRILGSTNLRITGTAHTATQTITCTPTTVTVNITNSGWWQARGGDVLSGIGISSIIPSTCIAPGCSPYLITHDSGNSPGNLTYFDALNTAPSLGSGTVSDEGWITNTNTYIGMVYSYSAFYYKAPSAVIRNNISGATADINTLATTGTASSDGYFWWFASSDLTLITSAIDSVGDRKVILFVDGKLDIDDEIHLNKGKGFFLAIVSGDIVVDGTIGTLAYSSNPTPHIEGLFYSSGSFETGTSTNQLKIRGSVASSQVTLAGQRDLSDNSLYPAEIFEFGPDLLFNFPKALSDRELVWKEVEP